MDKSVTIKLEITPDLPLFDDSEETNITRPESMAVVDHISVKKETNSFENEVYLKIEEVEDEIVDYTYNNHYYQPSDVSVKLDVKKDSFSFDNPLSTETFHDDTSEEMAFNKTTSIQTKPEPKAIKEQVWLKEEIVNCSSNEDMRVTHETCHLEDASSNESQTVSGKGVPENKIFTNVGFQGISQTNKKIKAPNLCCHICNDQLDTHTKLMKHVQNHYKEIPINNCKTCNKTFAFRSSLQRHMMIHKGERPHACSQCNKTFNQSAALKRHMRTHTGDKQYHCTDCNKIFAKDDLLQKHIVKNHKCEKLFTCNHCDARFKYNSSLERHSKVHQSNQTYGNNEQTNDNNAVSTDSCFIKVELPPSELVEKNNKPDKVSKKVYACKHCNKIYPIASSLRRHVLKVHAGLKPYACTHCDKSYSENCEFQRHLKVHTEKDKYKCDICEKTFSLNSTFTRHMRIHSGEKRHGCEICDKRFFESCSLQRHMRTHTGEKPFVCNQCNKAFVEKSALCQHRRIHTGEKPHECKVCHRRFSQLSALQRHVRTHTGEKPYECEWCGKRFIHSGNLSQHIATHTGHQSHFACTQCDKTFIHRKSYQNHKVKIHPGS